MPTSIRKRLTYTYIGLALGPVLLLGIIIVWLSYRTQQRHALDLQQQTSKQVAIEVESFIQAREQELRLLEEIQGFNSLDRNLQTNLLMELRAYQGYYEELTLLNIEGQEEIKLSRLDVITDADLTSRAYDEAFLIPVTTDSTYYGPVRFDQVTGEPLMLISIPLSDIRSGQIDGVLIADVRLKRVQEIIAGIQFREGESVYIVDTENRIIAHRNPSIVLRGTQFEPPAVNGRFSGLENEQAFLAVDSIYLGEQRLQVVTERALSNALASTLTTLIIISIFVLSTLLIAGILAVVMIRHMVLPIQSLVSTAKAISGGDLRQQATIPKLDELGVLAIAFNSMSAQLSEFIENLEERVKERTNQLQQEIGERKKVEVELELYQDHLEELVEKRTVELKEANQQIRAVTKQLNIVEEIEKKRLARELHDRVGQDIAALDVNLNIIREQINHNPKRDDPPEHTPRVLKDSFDLLKQISKHVRDVTADLRSPVLDDYGLLTALNWYGNLVTARTKIPIIVQGEDIEPRLPSEVESTLMRIAQEALTNTIKHSQATQIIVTLTETDEGLRLVIADDGTGFDPKILTLPQKGRGLGILSMRERAETIDGHCRVKTRSKQGTQVIIEVPR